MKIKIITDSAADLPVELYDEWDIEQIPHNVLLKDKVWKVGKDLSISEYYNEIAKLDYLPQSSAPDIADYQTAFDNALNKQKYDHIIYISVSSALTSTFNSVRIIARKFKGKITLIDSVSASGVQGLLVLTAAKLAKKGKELEYIIEILEEMKKYSILTVGFLTLDNVYKSGRLKSKLLLDFTRFMKVKPVAIMSKQGKLISKFPGLFFKRSMVKRLVHLTLSKIKNGWKYNMIITHLNNEQGVEYIENKLKQKVELSSIYKSVCSPIIGVNTGEGTIIVSLVPTIEQIEEVKKKKVH
ncbi:MAG: DegV family protein [Candidatus Heimdallarchaeum aukensis]|uniref:DegV family protein n=1 Tax=Candidatus Heimdallarchaeum aukensis TaxID=2876573 RepID=A0A9Y1BMC7_9ARCH|nr:MAG: DegV family protein [Candidatus Heimdallarchaeum aukensis]